MQIIQNKFLSYAPQINWLDIVKDSGAEIVIEDNGPECKERCNIMHMLIYCSKVWDWSLFLLFLKDMYYAQQGCIYLI